MTPNILRLIPQSLRLALLPALLSCLMLWRALLGFEVFAPTDILLSDPIIAQKPPGTILPKPQNPLLGDVVDTFLPWRMLVRDQLAEGRFPLWNPYNLVGTHLHANLQSQVLSPFTLLWLLLPPVWGLGVVAGLKWTLAGWGMALLLRKLGLVLPAAVFGSVAYQLSGPMAAWQQWPIADGLAWLPWMLWAALGWLDARKLVWLSALAAFVAFEWLAGHIETTFHSFVLLGVFALAALVGNRVGEWGEDTGEGREGAITHAPTPSPHSLTLTLGLVCAGLLGTALAAAQLLPFFDVLPSSYQWWLRGEVYIAGFSMSPSAAWLWLAPHGFGWAASAPDGHNWIEDNPYVGALTLLLAACNFGFWVLGLRFWKSPRTWNLKPETWNRLRAVFSPRRGFFWTVILAVSFSMAYGIPPLSFLRELPGFSSSFNWRLVSVAGVCFIVLGAMGFNRLLAWQGRPQPPTPNPQPPIRNVPTLTLALVGVGFLVAGLPVWSPTGTTLGGEAGAWKAWAAAMFCLGGALLLARLFGRFPSGILAVLAVGLLAVDLLRAVWGFNPTSDFSTFYPKTVLLDFAAKRGPTARMALVGEYTESNILAAYRAPDYRLYDATIDNRYLEYTRLMSPETFREAFRRKDPGLTTHLVLIKPSATLLAAVGIKWTLSATDDNPNGWEPAPAKGPVYRRALTKNGFSLWENAYALPYAYLSSIHHVIRGSEVADVAGEAIKRMQSLSVDTRNVNQVEDPNNTFPAIPNRLSPSDASGNVTVESYAPGDIKLRVTAGSERLLMVNEGWSKDWRATVDDQPTALYRTNAVVQGLVVPPGEHSVRLVYDPPAFRWGVGISLCALTGWLILTIVAVFKSRSDLKTATM